MSSFFKMSKDELLEQKNIFEAQYNDYKQMNLALDMSRGKPGSDQLNLSLEMLDIIHSSADCKAEDGFECRNYGLPDGTLEMRELFADMLGVKASNVIVGGNSSLNMMFDTVAGAMTHGMFNGEPWFKQGGIKFLCPSPGYDRHFSICAHFGIEMIPVEMMSDGPDMDKIEELVSTDSSIKGIWCVPKYSNPDGITYSDEVVKRFAVLKPAAPDFRIFWDNAYCVHDLTDTTDELLNIVVECEKAGNKDLPIVFTSTSKITFPGSGCAAMVSSDNNLTHFRKRISMQTIGPDKLNQLRHVRYFKNLDGVIKHMGRHRELLVPKFNIVLNTLEKELEGTDLLEWNKPNGGYFVSVNTLENCAKRIVQLCTECGVTLTPAGATFPNGNDPKDRNIRISPTFPSIDELQQAMNIFCVCVKVASIENLLTAK